MVRTRSGKSTTSAEKIQDQKAPPKKSPTKTPRKSPIKSPRKSPRKSPMKSPTKPSIKTNQDKNGFGQFFVDLSFWNPTDKTFTFYACFMALFVLGTAGYSVYGMIDTKYPDFCFFALILIIRCFDIATNVCNELLRRNHLQDVILFTESATNAAEIFLLLFMVQKSSQYYVTGVVVSLFCVLALNVKYKDEDKIWVRLVTYWEFIAFVALNYEYVIAEERVRAYFSFVFVSMILDAFDFPDQYLNGSKMCEGLIIVARSCGIYALLTAQVLSQGNQFTNLELIFKSWLAGMSPDINDADPVQQ
eukprot:417658_1